MGVHVQSLLGCGYIGHCRALCCAFYKKKHNHSPENYRPLAGFKMLNESSCALSAVQRSLYSLAYLALYLGVLLRHSYCQRLNHSLNSLLSSAIPQAV